jgi:hypothetical protein
VVIAMTLIYLDEICVDLNELGVDTDLEAV